MGLYGRLAIALALGLLIGLERGWKRRQAEEGRRVAGLRTFGLIGLLGGLAALLSAPGGPLLAAVFLGLAAVETAAYVRSSASSGDLGITTVVASFVTFGLGALAVRGYEAQAVAGAVATAALLGYKDELHVALTRLGALDLRATLQLLLISAVVLPFLPDRGFGPWEALNPYELWWMVVLIAGISYAGYAATRLMGERRGLAAAALAGGLVSSTAAALHFARLDRDAPQGWRLHAGAVLTASAVMFPRILLEALVLYPPLWRVLALPLGAMALAVAGPGLWLLLRGARPSAAAVPPAANPLRLGMALQFGALLALVSLAVAAFGAWFGEAGVLASAALAGLSDVDAITLSLARLARDGGDPRLSAAGILLAAGVNTAVKGAIVAWLGGRALAGRVCAVFLLALAAGGAALLLF